MSYKQQQAQQKAIKQAAAQAQTAAKQQAEKAEQKAEQEVNRLNAKKPDTSAILSAQQQAAKAGASGTMLTGPQGVDPSQLTIGKNTLLGM